MYREFLDTFDVGGEVDGKVTEQEFVNYYTNLGVSIDNDDYFELMIRNAWRIAGGEGWGAGGAAKEDGGAGAEDGAGGRPASPGRSGAQPKARALAAVRRAKAVDPARAPTGAGAREVRRPATAPWGVG